MAIATNQQVFRFRTDSLAADQATAGACTWGAAQNVNYNPPLDTPFRIRFAIADTGTTSVGATAWRIFASYNGGAYAQVTTTSSGNPIFSTDATAGNSADDSSITNSLLTGASGSFVNGAYDDTGSIASLGLATVSYFELEFGLQINSAVAAPGATLAFRVYRGTSTALNTYTVTPQFNVPFRPAVATTLTTSVSAPIAGTDRSPVPNEVDLLISTSAPLVSAGQVINNPPFGESGFLEVFDYRGIFYSVSYQIPLPRRSAFGSNIGAPYSGALDLTVGGAPTLVQTTTTTLSPAAASASLATVTPSVNWIFVDAPAAGSLASDSGTVVPSVTRTLPSPSSASLGLASQAPSLSWIWALPPAASTVSLTATAPATTSTLVVGSATLSGALSAPSVTTYLTPAAVGLSLSPSAPQVAFLEYPGTLSLSLSAPAAVLTYTYNFSPSSYTASLSASAPSLVPITVDVPGAPTLATSSAAPIALISSVDSPASFSSSLATTAPIFSYTGQSYFPSAGSISLAANAPVLSGSTTYTYSPGSPVLSLSAALPSSSFNFAYSPASLALIGSVGYPVFGYSFIDTAGGASLALSASIPSPSLYATPASASMACAASGNALSFPEVPGAAAMALSPSAPSLAKSASPLAGSLSLAASGNSLTFLDVAGVAPLALTTVIPSVSSFASPAVGSLSLSGSAPTPNTVVQPAVAALSLAGSVPLSPVWSVPPFGMASVFEGVYPQGSVYFAQAFQVPLPRRSPAWTIVGLTILSPSSSTLALLSSAPSTFTGVVGTASLSLAASAPQTTITVPAVDTPPFGTLVTFFEPWFGPEWIATIARQRRFVNASISVLSPSSVQLSLSPSPLGNFSFNDYPYSVQLSLSTSVPRLSFFITPPSVQLSLSPSVPAILFPDVPSSVQLSLSSSTPGFYATPADNPPFGILITVVDPWGPADPLPTLPRRLNPVFLTVANVLKPGAGPLSLATSAPTSLISGVADTPVAAALSLTGGLAPTVSAGSLPGSSNIVLSSNAPAVVLVVSDAPSAAGLSTSTTSPAASFSLGSVAASLSLTAGSPASTFSSLPPSTALGLSTSAPAAFAGLAPSSAVLTLTAGVTVEKINFGVVAAALNLVASPPLPALTQTPSTSPNLSTSPSTPAVTLSLVAGTASISLSSLAPSIGTTAGDTPGSAAINLVGPSPLAATSFVLTPSSASASLVATSPSISVAVLSHPGVSSLAISAAIPVASISIPEFPGVAAISSTLSSPVITYTGSTSPASAVLQASGTLPSVEFRPVPGASLLTTAASALIPSLGLSPGAVALTEIVGAPVETVIAVDNPLSVALALSTSAPTATTLSGNVPSVAALTISTAPPSISSSGPPLAPPSVDLSLQTSAPAQAETVSPNSSSLRITSGAPPLDIFLFGPVPGVSSLTIVSSNPSSTSTTGTTPGTAFQTISSAAASISLALVIGGSAALSALPAAAADLIYGIASDPTSIALSTSAPTIAFIASPSATPLRLSQEHPSLTSIVISVIPETDMAISSDPPLPSLVLSSSSAPDISIQPGGWILSGYSTPAAATLSLSAWYPPTLYEMIPEPSRDDLLFRAPTVRTLTRRDMDFCGVFDPISPGSERLFAIDIGQDLDPFDAISSATTSVSIARFSLATDPNPSNIIAGSVIISGDQIRQALGGDTLVPNATYVWLTKATTIQGNTIVSYGHLPCIPIQ